MVDVPVIQAFTHEGRALSVGETLSVSPVVAAALHRRGLVSVATGYRTREVTPDPEPEPETAPTPPRRRYRRRDLEAESS